MITYSTAAAGTFAFSSAPAIAMAPRSLAEKSFNEPINLPMGVRAPATITDVVMNTSKAGSRGVGRPIRPTGEAQSSPSGYRYVMTTDQVGARRILATSLVTG